jgi:XTP/dITP diphosphohydrolase
MGLFCGIIKAIGDAMKKTIWFASTNKGKISDLNALIGHLYEIKTPFDLDFEFDVDENADTFEGNSEKKARELFEIVKEPVISDDSGLMVLKLDNFPGVHSNRWYQGQANGWVEINELLLKKMEEANLKTESERAAVFVTVITYLDENIKKQFRGELKGTIATSLRGKNGFGYAPIFIPEGTDKTQAELSDENRTSASHRGRAMQKFINWIEEGEK